VWPEEAPALASDEGARFAPFSVARGVPADDRIP
jgi:hypothetical protein